MSFPSNQDIKCSFRNQPQNQETTKEWNKIIQNSRLAVVTSLRYHTRVLFKYNRLRLYELIIQHIQPFLE